MHSRTERALEIIIVHCDDLRVFVSSNGTATDIDFLHHLRIRIFLRSIRVMRMSVLLSFDNKNSYSCFFAPPSKTIVRAS